MAPEGSGPDAVVEALRHRGLDVVRFQPGSEQLAQTWQDAHGGLGLVVDGEGQLRVDDARQTFTLDLAVEDDATPPWLGTVLQAARSAPPADALPAGTALGGFRIGTVLGRGGMGTVYAAEDTRWGLHVALKVLRTRDSTDWQLPREFRRASQVVHPNLVRLLELHQDDAHTWFTMERIDGRPLTTAWRDSLDPRALRSWVTQIARALAHLHAHDLVHLDLKPSNLLVTPAGRAVVIDFGLSRDYAAERWPIHAGTPGFIPPELLRGAVPTPGADWWALGATLFATLQGRVWEGDDTLDGIPPAFRPLIAGLLQEDPARRADAVHDQLDLAPRQSPRRLAPQSEAHGALLAAWENSRGAPGHVVTVSGPSGPARSAVLERLGRDLRDAGGWWIRERCHPRDRLPYRALDALFSQIEPEGGRGDGGEGPRTGLLGALRGAPPPSEATDDDPVRRWREAVRALRDALRRASGGRPVLLTIDDAEHADVDSLRLLQAVCRGAEAPIRLLVLAHAETDTPSEGPAATSLLASSERIALQATPTTAEPAVRQDLTGSFAASADRAEAARLLRLVALSMRPLPFPLALQAIGADHFLGPMTLLEGLGLLRPTKLSASGVLELARPGLAEAALRDVAGPMAEALHADLLTAWRSTDEAPPETIATHAHGAGRHDEAIHAAEEAARAALDRFAFDHAAAWFGRAADWRGAEHPGARDLRVAQSDALVLARRRAEAGHLLLSLGDVDDRGALRARAAAHLLAAGHVEAGRSALVTALDGIRLRFPRGEAEVALRTLLELAGLAIGWRVGLGGPAQALERARRCWAAARGLLPTDPMMGFYLSVAGLRAARHGGDPLLRARLEAVVGSVLLRPLGGWFRSWGDRMLLSAEEVAWRDGGPLLLGVVAVGQQQESLLRFDWHEALRRAESIDRHFDALPATADVAWERAIATMGTLRALEEVAALPQADARAEAFGEDAEDLDDRYARVTALEFLAMSTARAGDTERARARVDEALSLWRADGCDMQHAYAVRVHATCDLLDGQPDEALRRVDALWPALAASGLLRLPLVSFDMHDLRIRTCLAARPEAGGDDPRVRESLRALTRATTPTARSQGALLGTCALLPRDPGVASRLIPVADAFEAAGAQLRAWIARWAAARARGDDATAEAIEDQLDDLGVSAPAWLAAEAPGAMGVQQPR